MTIHEKLSKIQSELKVGKPLFNKFGNFSYRSTENIFEALKPVLAQHGLYLLLEEDMVVLGSSERFYKKITAVLTDGKDRITSTSFTREDESQKGLTSSQLSGAVGSYGAKMALRGLLLLDDVLDDDHDKSGSSTSKPAPTKPVEVKAEVKAEPAPESFKRKPKAKPEVPKGSEEDDY